MNFQPLARFDWSLIRSFLAVLDAGSLMGAARQLNAQQPTLSRHVAELDAKPFARVRLVADAAASRDPLFAQVLIRRTDRRAYDAARPIATADAARMSAAVTGVPVTFGITGLADAPATDAAQVEAVRAIAQQAWRIELTTEAPMMESMRVLRIGSAEMDQYRDGISITSPMMVTLAKLGFVDRSKLPAPYSQGTVAQIKDFNTITASTPAYPWIVT
jgi:hypothetical protein